MTNYKEILRLSELGINNSQIAAALGCSRTTIIAVLQKAKEKGITRQKAAATTNTELSRVLFPSEGGAPGYKKPDYEYVHREMAKSGMTLQLLWFEYCDKCSESGDILYQLTQFKKYYRDFVVQTKATMHINRRPGELLEVDWAGQTASIIDTDTGEVIPAYIFVAALPYSGYAYVEAFLTQNQESWISAHVNAYAFLGGSTRILVPDNLKTGVEKVTRSETLINKTYQEMAQHYDTAVIPARVRTPKDKATVEGSVGIVSTWILASIRNQQFLSLKELNLVIREKLHDFNHKPFQKKDGSRASMFAEERLFLQPLPQYPFELATWMVATVQYNYHIRAWTVRTTRFRLNISSARWTSVSLKTRLKSFQRANVFAPTPGCTAGRISTARSKPICRRIIKNICNGTVTVLGRGQLKSAQIQPLWLMYSSLPTRSSNKATRLVWRS